MCVYVDELAFSLCGSSGERICSFHSGGNAGSWGGESRPAQIALLRTHCSAGRPGNEQLLEEPGAPGRATGADKPIMKQVPTARGEHALMAFLTQTATHRYQLTLETLVKVLWICSDYV